MSIFSELKRRNVFKVIGVYAVVGWLMMQLAATLESSLNLPPWFDSAITATLLLGLPIAILLAWAFELTPEGVRKTEADIEGHIDLSPKWFEVAVVLGLLLVIALSVWQQWQPGSSNGTMVLTTSQAEEIASYQRASANDNAPKPIADNSIAVLPFTDLSQAGDQEYFSDGIAEEILNVLVKVESLQITSRTSAFQFKDTKLGIPAIADALKARHILEGSVRKAGDNLRITAQLIDAQNDKHLWSDTYDRPLTTENIFAIQDEISNAIVNALKGTLGIQSAQFLAVKHSTSNLSAYELFLKARSIFQTRQALDEADELLIKATELDPLFADAWAMRAALQSLMSEYGYKELSYEQVETSSIEFADRALSIDENSALAMSVKSRMKLRSNEQLRQIYDLHEIINVYKKALSLVPKDPSTLNWLGLAYQFVGYNEVALKYYLKCVEYEPRYTPCVGNSIFTLNTLGSHQKAVELYLDALSNGVLETKMAPFYSLAQSDQELAFISALNSPSILPGWHRNGELYEAYKNNQLDHAALVEDAYKALTLNNQKLYWWQFAFTPLGFQGPDDDPYIDVFGTRHKNMNTAKIKNHIRKSGVYAYWQQHGYPERCKPLGEGDFQCEQF